MSSLTLEKLSVTLSGRSIIEDLSLQFPAGKITGIIGPNGSGKSTLLRALNQILPLSSGAIRFGETSLDTLSPRERARWITYVGSELETEFPLSALEWVSLGTFSFTRSPSMDDHSRVRQQMEEVGCWEYRDRILTELSSGERQRVHLARALVQNSKWICLDESFSRLDLHHQSRMGALLRKYLTRGTSFLFVSHDLNFTTDWADFCLLLKMGKVVAFGATEEAVTEANLRILYPDAEMTLSPHPVTGAMKVYFRA